MKKHFIYALMSAIALTGTVSFSSCSSTEDEVAEVNPGYNPVTEDVPVNFMFNFAIDGQASTRMEAGAVQEPSGTGLATTEFRGIKNAHIMCVTQNSGNGKFLSDSTTYNSTDETGNVTNVRDFDMDKVAVSQSLSSEKSSRVLEMSLPLKTNTILFYGRADGNSNPNEFGLLGSDDADDANGYRVDTDLSKISFHLCKRLSTANKPQFEQTQKLLAAILTCVMNVSVSNATVTAEGVPEAGIATYGFGFTIGDETHAKLAWSDYFRTDKKSPWSSTSNLAPLEEKLYKAYKEMTTVQTAELRNGSGPALRTTIKSLWSIVNSVRCASPTTVEEAVAKFMAQQIHIELQKYFVASVPTNGGSPATVSFRSVADASETDFGIISNLAADIYWPTEATESHRKPAATDLSAIATLSATSLGSFPENLNLPQGSCHIKFNDDKTFEFVQNYNSSAVGSVPFTVDDYYFPPELLYFGNSPIRVSNQEHVATSYPQTTTAWHTEANWPATKDSEPDWSNVANGEVRSSTRSVAMVNDINYGTALLETTVKYSGETLYDNNHYIQDRDYDVNEPNNTVDPNFTLVGILVGGQQPRVGWDFLPALKTTERQGFVFDDYITNGGVIPATGTSEKNYTLVFDNYNSQKDDTHQDKVYVALELLNNGNDFFGRDNLIPQGSHFYLIGELDPYQGAGLTEWPTYHALPPYNATTNTENHVKRVFIQDHRTVANFKIGQYSLQYAYLTVPDLRSSSVTLGLSVDLSWSSGLTFDDVVLGGNGQYPPPPSGGGSGSGN